ncbi:restriction endonuclease subunit S, partial [bacterium]|nr:restriction endonuclease subunit S [bacterium]
MSSAKTSHIDKQIVSSAEVANRDNRLDPSRYSRVGEGILRHIELLGLATPSIGDLPEFVGIYLPNRFTRVYLDDPSYGVPMLGTSSMFMARLPVDSTIRMNSKSSALWIKEGDILVSRSGTVGTSVLCGKSYTGHIASDDCFRLRLQETIRGYVAAYLQSSIGTILLARDSHGKVIRHLKDFDIKRVIVPLIDPNKLKRINGLMIDSASLVDDARESLHACERATNEVLGVPSRKDLRHLWLNCDNGSFVKSSEMLASSRLDPHFNDPGIDHLRNLFALRKHRALGKIADVWMPNRFARPPADSGYGVPFYSSADIMRTRRLPSSTISTRAERYLKQCIVKKGTILICRSG